MNIFFSWIIHIFSIPYLINIVKRNLSFKNNEVVNMEFKKVAIGAGLATTVLLGLGLRKISEAVKNEELAKPAAEQIEIVKENKVAVEGSNILINKRGVQFWLEKSDFDGLPKYNTVYVCSGYGCIFKTKFKITEDIYNDVKSIMDEATNATEERNSLASALNLLKEKAGKATGTDQDRPGEPFIGNGNKGQMSQLDETNNTLQYLYFLADKGYMKYHNLEAPQTDKFFIGTINVIVDASTKTAYTVGYDKEGKALIKPTN